MTIKGIIYMWWRLLPLLVFTGLFSGCIKENPDNCVTHCIMHVRAFDASGTELTANEVSSVLLYLFDDGNRLTRTLQAEIGQRVRIETRVGESLNVVAWGNLNGNSSAKLGDYREDCSIAFKQQVRSDQYLLSLDDLFHGTAAVGGGNREKELAIYRKVGGMALTARNLRSISGFKGDDYTVIVRETCSGIRFDGTFFGEKASYNPAGSFVVSGNREEYHIPAFNMVPQESGLSIDIYHGTHLVASITEDGNGTPVTVAEGMLTHVSIDFGTSVSVNVTLTSWGDEEVGKEF